MGTSGSGQVLKFMNGIFKVIKESAYSREKSYEKTLIGDSLVVTTLSRSTPIDGLDGKISVDSTWQYLFGRLRLTSVYRKVAVYAIQKDSLKEAGQFEQDVMGAYVYKSEELFEYSKTSKGKLVCAYTLNKASKNKLVLAKARKFTVKD
jgi:hypothetical protein